MKLEYKIMLAYKKYKRNKYKKAYTIIFFIILLLIFVGFSLKLTINNYLNDSVKSNYYSHILFLDIDKESQELAIENISKVFGVEFIVDSLLLENSVDFSDNYRIQTDGELLLRLSSKKLNNYEIICPKNFVPDSLEEMSNINSENLFDLEQYLNKELKLNYYQYIDNLNSQKKQVNLKLVELYENSSHNIDENVCYINIETMKKIFNDAYKNVDLSNQTSSLAIYIDDYVMINDVIKEASNMGYNLIPAVNLNEDLIDFFNNFVVIILLIIVISSYFFINSINIKKIIDEKKDDAIYRVVGYSQKDVKFIFIIETLLYLVKAFIILLFLLVVLNVGISILLMNNPYIFSKVTIYFSWISLFGGFIACLFVLVLSDSIIFRKNFKIELISCLGDL